MGEGETKHLIYQANGDEGELELNQINVSDIDDEGTITEVKQTLERQPMKNNVPTWNCQD
ncbi:hypothetical protein K439DRAFT_1633603 [Ramaria rubella]|nr:hypothetical protein K439DRAFT_1633603 [Ramaria rubella]